MLTWVMAVLEVWGESHLFVPKRGDNEEVQTLWPVIIYNMVKDANIISSPLCENVLI